MLCGADNKVDYVIIWHIYRISSNKNLCYIYTVVVIEFDSWGWMGHVKKIKFFAKIQ